MEIKFEEYDEFLKGVRHVFLVIEKYRKCLAEFIIHNLNEEGEQNEFNDRFYTRNQNSIME